MGPLAGAFEGLRGECRKLQNKRSGLGIPLRKYIAQGSYQFFGPLSMLFELGTSWGFEVGATAQRPNAGP